MIGEGYKGVIIWIAKKSINFLSETAQSRRSYPPPSPLMVKITIAEQYPSNTALDNITQITKQIRLF